MNRRRRKLLGAAVAAVTAPLVATPLARAQTPARCPAVAGMQGGIQLIGNPLPVVQHLAAVAQACSHPGFKVDFKLTPQARSEIERAFGATARSPFDAAVVSNGAFTNLYSRRQLAPLTDLVERFGARYRLEERMLVRVDGEVMAIAFMQNTQNLVYRQDLFERHRLAVPATYAELAEAAATLRAREPDLPFPLAQGYAKGFDIAVEFTNVLGGLDAGFFEPGSARPAFHRAAGVQAVAVMRSMLPFMTPNALASNTDDVMNQLQQGKAAIGVLWASRASRLDDPVASRVVGKMAFAPAPAVRPGGPSAAHLWWDGVVLPRQLAGGAARREAIFHVLMEMLGEASVRAGNDLTIWVRSAYRPGRFGTGVELAQKAGAKPWPAEPFFSLAHAEVGKVLPDALKDERPTAAVLEAAAAAYRRLAAENGFIGGGA